MKSSYEPSGHSGRSLSRFQLHEATSAISIPPWMVFLAHRRVTFAGTHLYTLVERGTVKAKCFAKEHNRNTRAQPGLEPGPLDPSPAHQTLCHCTFHIA